MVARGIVVTHSTVASLLGRLHDHVSLLAAAGESLSAILASIVRIGPVEGGRAGVAYSVGAGLVLQVVGHLVAMRVQERRQLRRRVQQHQRTGRHAVELGESPQTIGTKGGRLGPRTVSDARLAIDRSRGPGGRGGGGGVELVGGALGVVEHGGLAVVHVHLAQSPLHGHLELRAIEGLQLVPLDLVQQGHSRGFGVKGHGHGQWQPPRYRLASRARRGLSSG